MKFIQFLVPIVLILVLLTLFYFKYDLVFTITSDRLHWKNLQLNDGQEKNEIHSTTEDTNELPYLSNTSKLKTGDSHWENMKGAQERNKMISILLLRPGKSGSGTARERFQLSNIKFDFCHPLPCINQTRDAESVFITIRDPVERFVSAFNWRSLLICNDFNETRQPGRARANHPMEYCIERVGEKEIIHHKYKKNVNNLAMALCQQQHHKEAITDVDKISHAKYSLSDWLQPSKIWHNSEGESKLLPLVLESGYDFKNQIDESIRFVFSQIYDAEALEKKENKYKNKVEQKAETIKAMAHSSSSYKPPSVQKVSECCLARYLHLDYELIQTISKTSCDNDVSGECQDSLKSIYMRRSPFLRDLSKDNFDFCSKGEFLS